MKSSYEYQERQPFNFYSIKLGVSPQTAVGVNFNPLKWSNTKSYKIELSAIVTNIGLTLILASSTNRCGCHKARHYITNVKKLSCQLVVMNWNRSENINNLLIDPQACSPTGELQHNASVRDCKRACINLGKQEAWPHQHISPENEDEIQFGSEYQ